MQRRLSGDKDVWFSPDTYWCILIAGHTSPAAAAAAALLISQDAFYMFLQTNTEKKKLLSMFSPSPCFITQSHLLMAREAGVMVRTVCGQERMKRPNHTPLIMESSLSHDDGIERYWEVNTGRTDCPPHKTRSCGFLSRAAYGSENVPRFYKITLKPL